MFHTVDTENEKWLEFAFGRFTLHQVEVQCEWWKQNGIKAQWVITQFGASIMRFYI